MTIISWLYAYKKSNEFTWEDLSRLTGMSPKSLRRRLDYEVSISHTQMFDIVNAMAKLTNVNKRILLMKMLKETGRL
tara:strand:+ start:1730 stop:1960 length:231 start_codon:yes stop_codon:yes gene_type:complete